MNLLCITLQGAVYSIELEKASKKNFISSKEFFI